MMLWNILIAIASLLVITILGFIGWYRWKTRSRRPPEPGYEYVVVTDEGCGAREVTANEREYLETEFEGADGARPYIKFRYESVDGWRSLDGFLLRRQLPAAVQIRKPTDEEEQFSGG